MSVIAWLFGPLLRRTRISFAWRRTSVTFLFAGFLAAGFVWGWVFAARERAGWVKLGALVIRAGHRRVANTLLMTRSKIRFGRPGHWHSVVVTLPWWHRNHSRIDIWFRGTKVATSNQEYLHWGVVALWLIAAVYASIFAGVLMWWLQNRIYSYDCRPEVMERHRQNVARRDMKKADPATYAELLIKFNRYPHTKVTRRLALSVAPDTLAFWEFWNKEFPGLKSTRVENLIVRLNRGNVYSEQIVIMIVATLKRKGYLRSQFDYRRLSRPTMVPIPPRISAGA